MLLIDDAIVVTLNDDHDVFFDGAVAIDGDRISAVGSSADVRARVPVGTPVLDAHGGAVLPGLVDLHYHTALGRGWADHLPLAVNLDTFWYPLVRAIDRGRLLGGAAELRRVDPVRRDDRQRHVPPHRRDGEGGE
jgi:5-methylthioadenosine/S-adenosylhomocysteine deaminase